MKVMFGLQLHLLEYLEFLGEFYLYLNDCNEEFFCNDYVQQLYCLY